MGSYADFTLPWSLSDSRIIVLSVNLMCAITVLSHTVPRYIHTHCTEQTRIMCINSSAEGGVVITVVQSTTIPWITFHGIAKHVNMICVTPAWEE